jgi:hypothetical protein
MRGQRTCRNHGGASPQALRSAQERMAALIDPAFRTYSRALRSRDLATGARVARDVFERNSIGARDEYTAGQVADLLRGLARLFGEIAGLEPERERRRRFAEGFKRLVGSFVAVDGMQEGSSNDE